MIGSSRVIRDKRAAGRCDAVEGNLNSSVSGMVEKGLALTGLSTRLRFASDRGLSCEDRDEFYP